MSKVEVPLLPLISRRRAVEKLLYALVIAQQPANLKNLAGQVGLAERTTRYYLDELRRAGYISTPDLTPVALSDPRVVTLNAWFLQDATQPVAIRYLYLALVANSTESWCFLSLNALAKQAKLAHSTVSRAMQTLRAARIVETFSGEEHFIRDPAENLASQVTDALIAYIRQGRPTPPGIVVSWGERLMKAWLDTLVASRYYSDNVPLNSTAPITTTHRFTQTRPPLRTSSSATA